MKASKRKQGIAYAFFTVFGKIKVSKRKQRVAVAFFIVFGKIKASKRSVIYIRTSMRSMRQKPTSRA